MNFEITIYPKKEIKYSYTWEDIQKKYIALYEEFKVKDKLESSFHLLETDEGRAIIMNPYNVRLLHPRRIIKKVLNPLDLNVHIEEDNNTVYQNIEYHYSRRIELGDSYDWLFCNIDFGSTNYKINRDSFYIIPESSLNQEQEHQIKNALDKFKFKINLEADIGQSERSLLFLALIFARLVDGILFIEHRFYEGQGYIPVNYYTINQLEKYLQQKVINGFQINYHPYLRKFYNQLHADTNLKKNKKEKWSKIIIITWTKTLNETMQKYPNKTIKEIIDNMVYESGELVYKG